MFQMRRLAGIIVRSENRRFDNRRNAPFPSKRNRLLTANIRIYRVYFCERSISRRKEGRKEGGNGILWKNRYRSWKGDASTFESEIERVDFLKRKVIIIAYR